MPLELITFRFCPFGQRCLIALNEKGVACDITYIELDNPPDWFPTVSPLKKVPVLRVRGKTLFDSAVINEYLDETIPPALHPGDELERALNRSWIAYAGELLSAQLAVFKAGSEKSFDIRLTHFLGLVAKLETAPINGPFFGGGRFSLVDAAYAPFFIRAQLMAGRHEALSIRSPVLSDWAEALLDRPSVIRSQPQDFGAGYPAFLAKKGAWLLNAS